jgi:hypothetical protein
MILILAIELQLFMVLTPRLAMRVGTTSVVRNTGRACHVLCYVYIDEVHVTVLCCQPASVCFGEHKILKS